MDKNCLTKIYFSGFMITSGVIGIGNLFCSVFFTLGTCSPFIGLVTVPFSIVKGFMYGLIWPIFIPNALYKSTFNDPIKTGYGYINRNGLLMHFMPLSNTIFFSK